MTRTKAKYVPLSAAAEHLSVTERTVRNFISDGRLTGYRLGGRAIRVDMREVEALLEPIPTVGTMKRGGRR